MDLPRHALRSIQDTGQTHCHDEKQGLAACSFGQQMNNMITLQWRTWVIQYGLTVQLVIMHKLSIFGTLNWWKQECLKPCSRHNSWIKRYKRYISWTEWHVQDELFN